MEGQVVDKFRVPTQILSFTYPLWGKKSTFLHVSK